MEPDGFRLALNSLIQALRNVTWVLQKQKADLPEFDVWYPAWQATAKSDAVMGWVVKARNRVVKEADLELLSTARLTVSFDWLSGGEMVFNVPPRQRPVDIAAMLLSKGVPPYPDGEGTLTIARRWVDRMLPDHEVLDACDHAYGLLVDVIRQAHEASGVKECDLASRKRECVNADLDYPLDCVWVDTDVRTADFDLGNLSQYVPRRLRIDYDPELAEKAAANYGVTEIPEGDAIARVPGMFRNAARMLQSDGHVLTVAMFFRGEDLVDIQAPVFEDQGGKMLAMRGLASRVRALNADGFMFVSEVWTAPRPTPEKLLSGNYVSARNHPDRGEALQVTAITKDRRAATAIANFTHGDSGIEIETDQPAIETWDQTALMSYRPILQVWGIADPDPMAPLRQSLHQEQAEAD